jgi:hypothetical protein
MEILKYIKREAALSPVLKMYIRSIYIAEAKQRSRWSVIGWMTKIYYLELLRASAR